VYPPRATLAFVKPNLLIFSPVVPEVRLCAFQPSAVASSCLNVESADRLLGGSAVCALGEGSEYHWVHHRFGAGCQQCGRSRREHHSDRNGHVRGTPCYHRRPRRLRFNALMPGTYVLRCKFPGFKTFVREGIQLTAWSAFRSETGARSRGGRTECYRPRRRRGG